LVDLKVTTGTVPISNGHEIVSANQDVDLEICGIVGPLDFKLLSFFSDVNEIVFKNPKLATLQQDYGNATPEEQNANEQ
jgi:hypothetical protein